MARRERRVFPVDDLSGDEAIRLSSALAQSNQIELALQTARRPLRMGITVLDTVVREIHDPHQPSVLAGLRSYELATTLLRPPGNLPDDDWLIIRRAQTLAGPLHSSSDLLRYAEDAVKEIPRATLVMSHFALDRCIIKDRDRAFAGIGLGRALELSVMLPAYPYPPHNKDAVQ
jgi:hypothetical protein